MKMIIGREKKSSEIQDLTPVYVSIALEGYRGVACVYTPGSAPHLRQFEPVTLRELSEKAIRAALKLIDSKRLDAVVLTDVISGISDTRIVPVPKTRNWFAYQMAQVELDRR